MDFMPLIPFLGVSVPESLVLYYMALTLVGTKGPLYFLVALSLFTSLFSYAIRTLPLVFGVHTFLQLVLMVILLNLFFRLPWKVSIIAVVISGFILGLAEGISVPLLARTFSFTLGQVVSDPLLRILFTLPHLVLLIGLTYIAVRRGWRLRSLERMIIAGQRTEGYNFTGKVYLFILLLIQTLMLALLNISFHIYSARVFPTFDLGALVATSSALIIFAALTTILVANYLLKVTEREARLDIELRYVREMQKLNLQMRSQRHDFYNHLTAIYGYLKASQYNKAESYIETLYQDVRRIKDLLEVNPPELGALLSLKEEGAKARGIEFRWRVNVESGVLPLPPEELTQLTGNLLDNALDAAVSGHPPGVDLTLTTNKLGLMLKVSNTGDPIPRDILGNIFTAGYTTKDGTQHSGLGLFIVKQIVDRHGGQLDLAEPEDYPGVRFVVFIPWNS